MVRDQTGNPDGALKAYLIAQETFETSEQEDFWAATLNIVARTYYAQGRYAEALASHEQALAILRKIGDRASEGTTLNHIGGIYADQGRFTEALESFEQALGIARENGDWASEGTTLNNIGLVYHAEGRYAEALQRHEQARVIAREIGDRASEGATLVNIGGIYADQGRFTDALESFEQALAILRELGDRVGVGTTLNNIGTVHDAQGRYAEALESYDQALAILRELGDQVDEGTTLNNIGAVHGAQGRYAEALESYDQSLVIARELGDRVGEGITLNNIGLIKHYQGRYGEALESYEQALGIAREVGNQPSEGITLTNIGGIYADQQRYGEALESYEQALVILREIGDRASEGTTLANIGVIYADQERFTEALESFEQALGLAREVGNRIGESIPLTNIGGIYANQERYTEALERYEQALAILREVGDRASEGVTLSNIGEVYHAQGHYVEALEAHEQSLAIAREVGNRIGEGKALNSIGAIYADQGRYTAALRAFEDGMTMVESLRSGAGSEVGRASFIAQYASLYRQVISLYHRQGQDAEAFYTNERGRSRAFLDGLATGYVELSDDSSTELLRREQETYTARQAAQDALAKARGLNLADAALVTNLEEQLAAVEQEHQAALDAITSRGDQLAALVPGRSDVLDLTAVQALLNDQTTLVSYWVVGNEGSLAFIITANDFSVVELPEATPTNLAETIRNVLSGLNREQAYPKPLHDLYDWLVAPVAEYLQTPQIVIVPHIYLHYVPFAALTDGQTYFGQQHLLSVIPSASALPFIQQNAAESAAKANTQSLVFGNPTTGDPSLPPLVHAATEAKAIASLLGTVAVTDAEASETRLRDEAAGSKVIHLAAHGGYNVANPLYSAIYLAPGGEGAAGDGRLETHEIYGLDLKGNELVVLSACETNVGELSAGDELVGMTRAFFFAGTPTVLSSLWSVDDSATEALMTAFYGHWQAGMGKAEALQTAQEEVRSNPQWASPFYWAGFVLNGDPGPVTTKASEPAEQPVESTNSLGSTLSTSIDQNGRSFMPVFLVVVLLALGLAVTTIVFLRWKPSLAE